MIVKQLQNNQGVALLVTLGVLTVLTVAALELNRRSRSAIVDAALLRDQITLHHIAAAGVEAARALLVKDKMASSADTLHEEWADPERLGMLLQGITFPEGKVSIRVSDELSKIQVNALVVFPAGSLFNELQLGLWNRFLQLVTPTDLAQADSPPTTVINSLKDWLDSHDGEAVTGLDGAESSYYRGLSPPYACPNAPVEHLSELTLIKGIGPSLLYGTPDFPGIADYLTVFGLTRGADDAFTYEGRINLNTAGLAVIAALLPEGSESLAQAIYSYRNGFAGALSQKELSNPTWYLNAPGIGDTRIDPQLITIASDYFRIEAEATLHELKMKVASVVHREIDPRNGNWTCRTLSWQVD